MLKGILVLTAAFVFYGTVILLFSCFSYEKDADYLIVLGCGLDHDKETEVMRNRTARALAYLRTHPECLAILSGGITAGNTVSEASVMKRIMLEEGLPTERIIPEESSLNTPENMKFSKEKMEKGKTAVVCSSDYHILRACLLARKYGYRVQHICCRSSVKELLFHIPLEEIFLILNLAEKN